MSAIPPSIAKIQEDDFVLSPVYQVSFMPEKRRSHVENFALSFFLVAREEWATIKINFIVFFLHTSAAGVSLWDRVVAVCIHHGVTLWGKDSQ